MRVRGLVVIALSAAVMLFAFLPCAGQEKEKAKSKVKMTPPIVIDVSLSALEKSHAVKKVDGRKFFVGEPDDEEDEDDSVGYTRTGIRTVSAIVCDPLPSEAVRLTLANALAAQGLLAGSAKEASFVIDVASDLKLTEDTRKLHQAVVAVLKIEVSVWDVGDPSRVKKFKMEAVGERKTFDTTKQAQTAAREAVSTAVMEILKSLDSL